MRKTEGSVGQPRISIEQVGICSDPECKKPFSIGDDLLPRDHVGVGICGHCGKTREWACFGYKFNELEQKYLRKRWAGPRGEWWTREPKAPFLLDTALGRIEVLPTAYLSARTAERRLPPELQFDLPFPRTVRHLRVVGGKDA